MITTPVAVTPEVVELGYRGVQHALGLLAGLDGVAPAAHEQFVDVYDVDDPGVLGHGNGEAHRGGA